MNVRCTICDAVLSVGASSDRCPECGARAVFQIPTTESPRHARTTIGETQRAWEFAPDGPVLRRMK